MSQEPEEDSCSRAGLYEHLLDPGAGDFCASLLVIHLGRGFTNAKVVSK